jgi:choline monooxygenase
VVFDYWFRPETNDSFIEESIAVADRVQMEDGEICEQVQRNLSSRSYTVGRFSAKRENGGYHFHCLLHAALKA